MKQVNDFESIIEAQVVSQVVYLNFDGAVTSYNGETLIIDQVEVERSDIDAERVESIVATLNQKYAGKNIFFVTSQPEDGDFSTIHIGRSTSFDFLGSFAGIAETIDTGNTNRNDKAFVLLNAEASDDYLVMTIQHETNHLLGGAHDTVNGDITDYTAVSADAYENDNSRFKAKTISIGASQSRTIHVANDEDWIKFTVSTTGFYSIRATGGDTVLQLYSFENQAFGYNDDRGNGDLGSAVTAWLYAGDSYYARVTSYAMSSTFSYTISLTAGVIADAYESKNDNSMSTTSTTLSPGYSQVHTIHSATDVDWIKVNITSAGSYAFMISTGELAVNQISLEVYNTSGTRIAYNSGENPYCYGNISAGTYYMRVAAKTSGTIAGEYIATVSVNDLSNTSMDRYEYDDEPSYAEPIRSGETQYRSLTIYTTQSGTTIPDVDWITFSPTVTGTYRLAVSGTSAPIKATLYTSADDEDGILLPVAGNTKINPFVENYLIAGMKYYLRLSAEFTTLNIPSYTLKAELVSAYTAEADTYESDNTKSTAKTITAGSSQAHSLHTASDVDWLKFTPTASGWYTFYTGARNGNAGDGDLLIGLYNESGTLLTYDDDSFTGYNALLSYNMTAGQNYYLVVMSARTNMVIPYYTISLVSGIIEDAYDVYMDERSVNDNTRQNANVISVGQTQAHTIHSASDVDWVEFVVDTTGYYTIQTGGAGDTIITVYDKDGNFLQIDDDSGIGRNASVTMRFVADTVYYAKVSSYQNALIPHYTLSLSEAAGGGGDAYENDNTMATAKGIIAGETQSHSIHAAGDVDWVKIRPIQTGTYQIQTTGNGDLKLDLYSVSGVLLATDDDSGVGLNARIGYVLNANTDYYIKAYTYNPNVIVNSYGLNVALMVGSELGDEYENDDSPSSAKPITLGTTQSHSIHIAGDVDWVTFTPTVSAEYTIQTTGSGLNCDTQLYLYASLADAQAGRYLQWDDDSGSDRNALISRVLTTGSTYYIKAQAWSSYTIPSYGLRVTQNNGTGANAAINGDEYENDDLSGACKPIAIGSVYTHSIHVQSDTDWVRFFTRQDGIYTIQTTGDSDMSFILYKRIPGGALVPYENGNAITTGGTGNNALYSVYLESENWYYGRITTSNRASTTQSYGIRVDIDPSSAPGGDQYEKAGGKASDNLPSLASWLTLGNTQIHSIHAPGDVDWVSYRAVSATSIVFTAANTQGKEMRLFVYEKQNDGSLSFVSQSLIGSEGVTSVSIQTVAGKTYYVRAQALNATTTISSYQLAATYVKDSYEDDDTSSKATLLAVGGNSQTHNIHTQTDVDWYKIVITATATYEFETSGSGDTYGMLYRDTGSSNALILQAGGGGPGKNFKISASLTAGTYYLRVSGENNSLVESYTITARRPITAYDEPNDTKANATVLTIGGTKTGSFHTTTDVDYFKLSTGNAGTYKVAANNSQIMISLYVGNSDAAVATGIGSVSYSLATSGTIYAKLTNANGSLMDSYAVTAEYTAPKPVNPEENYVVLFAGGYNKYNNYARYYYNLKSVYESLVANYNIPKDHIYVIYADGTNPALDYRPYSEASDYYNSDMTYANGSYVGAGTSDNLRNVLSELSRITDSNDHLLVYVYDHGSGNNSASVRNEETICTWNQGGVSGAQFNSWISGISAGYQTYLFAQCYAGGILDAINFNSGSKKIYAAAADTHYSTSTSRISKPTGVDIGGFAYEVRSLFDAGINDTSRIANYVITNNYSRINGNDDPYDKTNYSAGFQIFAQA